MLPRPVVAVMSSGFFGFFAHAGFLQALADLGVEPDAYAGSSSGALVAAYAAGGLDPGEMLARFSRLRRDDFWDPPRPAALVRSLLSGLRGQTGYLAGEAFQTLLEQNLPCATFEACPRGCLMVALDLVSGRRVVLDQGPLAPAVRASGAVPMLFAAVEHMGGLLVDGGLVDKAPLLAAVRRFGAKSLVVHLLPSASLEGPPLGFLAQRGAPWRLQAKAVDAARQQHYEDQLALVREQGLVVAEVRQRELVRCGPRRLHLGPQAFAQARAATAKMWNDWILRAKM
ncbi:MAG: patatin-like phospholipase family protein [Thermodesulfobacteriota bacterium]